MEEFDYKYKGTVYTACKTDKGNLVIFTDLGISDYCTIYINRNYFNSKNCKKLNEILDEDSNIRMDIIKAMERCIKKKL